MIPAKEIMYEDKLLVHSRAQKESRNVLFRSILSITKAAATCVGQKKVSNALMSLNHPISGRVKTTNNVSKEQALTAGFAYLLQIVDKMTEIRQYTGIETAEKVFEQATNYLLIPKAVHTKEKVNQVNSMLVRIGNLTFTAPGTEIWNDATSIVNKTARIITHITLEQRAMYTKDFIRSQSLKAVRECAVRQEHIKANASIASIIKNSGKKDVTTISILNTWR